MSLRHLKADIEQMIELSAEIAGLKRDLLEHSNAIDARYDERVCIAIKDMLNYKIERLNALKLKWLE